MKKMKELFDIYLSYLRFLSFSTKEKSLEELIEDLTLYEEISGFYINFETSKMIDTISEQICSSDDQNKLKNLPRKVFYLIIKNKHFNKKMRTPLLTS